MSIAAEPKSTGAGDAKAIPQSRAWPLWPAAAIYFVFCTFIQWHLHAGAAAFGNYPDEPAHYVSGLLIRDYMISGKLAPPLSFATAYYNHLPYFAIGHWPPLFYGIEGLWVLLFGPQRSLVLLLSGIFAAGSATLIFGAIRRRAGWFLAFAAGMVFLSLPEVRRQVCATMLDLPVTFGVLGATLYSGRYLKSGRWRDAVGFAVSAAAACLTKYSALYVCLLPVFGLITLRRWGLLRQASFWIQPAIVVLLLAPWVRFTAQFAEIGFPEGPIDPLPVRFAHFVAALVASVPWPAWLLIVPGAALWAWRSRGPREMEVVFLIHAPAGLALLAASSVSADWRYFTPVIAALLVVSFAGWASMNERVRFYMAGIALAASIAVTFSAATAIRPPLRANDFRPLVDRVIAEGRWQNSTILAPSDAEGPFIAEFAMRDPRRPSYQLLRPGKVLASDNWLGQNYRPKQQTATQVMNFLQEAHVRLVILPVRLRPNARIHERLLEAAIRGNAGYRLVPMGPTASNVNYEIYESDERP